jgi:hypothetical protein
MQGRSPPLVKIFLHRTAGPYIGVIFDRFIVALRCPIIPEKRISGPLALMSTRPRRQEFPTTGSNRW